MIFVIIIKTVNWHTQLLCHTVVWSQTKNYYKILLTFCYLLAANDNIVVFQDYNEHFRDLNVSTSGFPELHRNNLEKKFIKNLLFDENFSLDWRWLPSLGNKCKYRTYLWVEFLLLLILLCFFPLNSIYVS